MPTDSSPLIWKAHAKINLTLKVLGKRDDGFHELESIMARIGLHDTLEFSPSDAYSLSSNDPTIPLDESNLVTRAARAMEKHTGENCQWSILLEKNIPHGAGLGGGSSDAATTLLALNELLNAKLSLETLTGLAAEIGSDIPFFLHQQTCMIEGRGERVKPYPIEKLSGTSILLLKPQFAVSTPDAYRNCLGASPLPGISYAAQQLPCVEVINDLEKPVFSKHLFLAEIKAWLLAQTEVDAAMMSGSGSTMIAWLDPQNADMIVNRAHEQLDPSLWTCKTIIL